jgi:hypothetical protein
LLFGKEQVDIKETLNSPDEISDNIKNELENEENSEESK